MQQVEHLTILVIGEPDGAKGRYMAGVSGADYDMRRVGYNLGEYDLTDGSRVHIVLTSKLPEGKLPNNCGVIAIAYADDPPQIRRTHTERKKYEEEGVPTVLAVEGVHECDERRYNFQLVPYATHAVTTMATETKRNINRPILELVRRILKKGADIFFADF